MACRTKLPEGIGKRDLAESSVMKESENGGQTIIVVDYDLEETRLKLNERIQQIEPLLMAALFNQSAPPESFRRGALLHADYETGA
jgi:hypothetical protein